MVAAYATLRVDLKGLRYCSRTSLAKKNRILYGIIVTFLSGTWEYVHVLLALLVEIQPQLNQ
jgi:hypothetical protein